MMFKKTGKEAENMIRNLGYLAAGVVVGLVVTGMIGPKGERRSNRGRPLCGNTGKYGEALQSGGGPFLRIP